MSITDAISVAKTMKKPIVHITPEYMLGTDSDFCTLSTIIYPSEIARPISVKLTDVYDEEKAKKLALEKPLEFNKLSLVEDRYINTWDEQIIYSKIFKLYRNLSMSISSANYIEINDIKQYNSFASIIKMKANDRHRWQYLDFDYTENLGRYIMSAFTQIHPVNSTDKVNLKIYDIDIWSFIACFEIIKKKNIIINEYIRYLYLK